MSSMVSSSKLDIRGTNSIKAFHRIRKIKLRFENSSFRDYTEQPNRIVCLKQQGTELIGDKDVSLSPCLFRIHGRNNG